MPVGDVWNVQFLWSYNGTYGLNNLYYEVVSSGGFSPTPFDVELFVNTHVLDHIIVHLCDIVEFMGMKARKITDPDVPHHSFNGQFGSHALNMIAPFLAINGKKLPVQRGVRPGWVHLGGLPQSYFANGIVIPAQLANVAAAVGAFAFNIHASGEIMIPVIWTRPNVDFPAGRTIAITGVRYTGMTTQRGRQGTRNTLLLPQFGY